MQIMKEGIYPELSNAVYHEYDNLGSTDLKSLLYSYGHYKAAKETRTTTAPMQFGSASHSIILEDDESDIIKTKGSSKTNEYKEACEFYKDKSVISNADYDLIMQMKEVFFKHKQARNLIKQGIPEQSIFWKDEMFSEVNGKCRPDYLLDDVHYITDYKTSINPVDIHTFPKNAINFGYDISASWYLRGGNKMMPLKDMVTCWKCHGMGHYLFAEDDQVECEICNGNKMILDEWGFIIIAQEKVKPFAVQVYTCARDFIELGNRKVNHALTNYQLGLEKNLNAYEEKSLILNPPFWAMQEY